MGGQGVRYFMTELTWEAKDSCKPQEEILQEIDAILIKIECMVEIKRGLTKVNNDGRGIGLDEAYVVVGLNFRCLTLFFIQNLFLNFFNCKAFI